MQESSVTYTADGEKVEVTTGVHPTKDALYARIVSNLLKDHSATVALRFSYPTGKHADDGNDWAKPERHHSTIIAQDKHSALIKRTLDSTTYYVRILWEGEATFKACDRHHFELTTDENILIS